jgi:hypothetical protein
LHLHSLHLHFCYPFLRRVAGVRLVQKPSCRYLLKRLHGDGKSSDNVGKNVLTLWHLGHDLSFELSDTGWLGSSHHQR